MCYLGSSGSDVPSLSNAVVLLGKISTGVNMAVSVFPKPKYTRLDCSWYRSATLHPDQRSVLRSGWLKCSPIICHHTDHPLLQLGHSIPALAAPLSRPLMQKTGKSVRCLQAYAFQRIKNRGSDQKMAVTTRTGEARLDKEWANIRHCAERRGFGRHLHPCETLEADACQKIVCSQREKQRISFKVEWECRTHLIPEAARAYSAKLIHREEELMNMEVDK